MELKDDGLLSEEEYKFLYSISEERAKRKGRNAIIRCIKSICTYFSSRIKG